MWKPYRQCYVETFFDKMDGEYVGVNIRDRDYSQIIWDNSKTVATPYMDE